jgi:hypothetical protein
MPAFDSGFKIVARASGRQMADIALVPVDEWAPIVSEVQTTDLQLREVCLWNLVPQPSWRNAPGLMAL